MRFPAAAKAAARLSWAGAFYPRLKLKHGSSITAFDENAEIPRIRSAPIWRFQRLRQFVSGRVCAKARDALNKTGRQHQKTNRVELYARA